jgi:polar amino acid transport system substrate-binding protein
MSHKQYRSHPSKRFLVFCFTFFCLLIGSFNGESIYAESTCQFIMGYEQWKPYSYTNESNKVTGLDIELVQAIISNLGCKLTFQELVNWRRLLWSVEHGVVHIAAAADFTKERARWAYFSKPYRTSKVVMFVLKGTSKKYPFLSLDTICNSDFKIGVSRGVYYGEHFNKLMKNPDFRKNIQEITMDKQNLKKLLNKRIDGFLEDSFAGMDLIRSNQVVDKIEIHPVHVNFADQYLLLSKKSVTPDMVDRINKSLAEIKAQGTYDKIINKYLK